MILVDTDWHVNQHRTRTPSNSVQLLGPAGRLMTRRGPNRHPVSETNLQGPHDLGGFRARGPHGCRNTVVGERVRLRERGRAAPSRTTTALATYNRRAPGSNESGPCVREPQLVTPSVVVLSFSFTPTGIVTETGSGAAGGDGFVRRKRARNIPRRLVLSQSFID